MLPSLVNYKGLQIASFWNPANILGGDIFNAIQGEGKTLFYMVDVCGHDVTSALVTISVSQFFNQHANSSTSQSPKDMMSALNKEYPFERFERFFTVFYLILDPFTGYFKYSCAGHPPAVLLKRSGGYKLLDKGGVTIGIEKNLSFEEAEGFLDDGDKVIMYTDGILELEDPNGEPFGANRFYALLESLKKEPISIIIQEVTKSLNSFNNFSADDISLLGFERNSLKETRFE
ncbi:MAG: PP2C family protein-serine/threonine phosphatase [Parachlamydiaceae bacterium]